MDSKLLHAAATHTSVTWDSDWVYFGTDDEIKTELIEDLIDTFLADAELNLVHRRMNSGLHERHIIKTRIHDLLGKEDFQLWNKSLTRVVDFNRIGVLRRGQK